MESITCGRLSGECERGTQECVKYQDILYTRSQDILYTTSFWGWSFFHSRKVFLTAGVAGAEPPEWGANKACVRARRNWPKSKGLEVPVRRLNSRTGVWQK